MKYIYFLIAFLFASSLKAQTDLNFNTRLIDAEDKWVVLPMSKDSTYIYGFIYLDNMAGLTFNLEGTFKVQETGFIAKKQPVINRIMKRIAPNNVKIAIIPASRFKELEIQEFPDWLKSYKSDTSSVDRLFRLGFTYNAWNECTKALTYLDRVNQINPNYNRLDFEYAFAYNALKQYDKAIVVLEKALKSKPKDCNLYKELLFAQMNLGPLDKAVETCKKALTDCADQAVKSEMSYNITYQYFKLKNKEQFKLWAEEAKKWINAGDRYSQNIAGMEAELNK